jgi:hypothetical protein
MDALKKGCHIGVMGVCPGLHRGKGIAYLRCDTTPLWASPPDGADTSCGTEPSFEAEPPYGAMPSVGAEPPVYG